MFYKLRLAFKFLETNMLALHFSVVTFFCVIWPSFPIEMWKDVFIREGLYIK